MLLLVTTFQNTEIEKKNQMIYVNHKWYHDKIYANFPDI